MVDDAGADRAGSEDGTGGDGNALGYRAALDELDRILRELEDEAVDVDQLSARVRRAGELIALCRDRILGARLEVSEIVARLEAPGDDD